MKNKMVKLGMNVIVAGIIGLGFIGGTAQAAAQMVDLKSSTFVELVTEKANNAKFDPGLILFIAEQGNPRGSSDNANVFYLPEEQIVCNPKTGEYQNIREVFPKFDSDVKQNVEAVIVVLEELRAQDPALFEQLQERWNAYQMKAGTTRF